jgi:hypothetical protein
MAAERQSQRAWSPRRASLNGSAVFWQRSVNAQRTQAAHSKGAAAQRRSHDACRSGPYLRCVARARAPDRGSGVRKLQKAMPTATANRPKQLPPVRHLRTHGGAPASISASSWGSLRAHFEVRSALPETAFGIRNLALDDRVEDCAEGRQLGKGRAAFRRGGEGHQRL